MNDFTKEDLDSLYIAIRYWEKKRYGDSHPGTDLQKKLSNLIDNYCEHPEARRYTYIVAGCMSLTAGGEKINYCDKCKNVWCPDK